VAARLGVVADAEAARLAGSPGAAPDGDVVVALGPPAEAPRAPWVLWREDDAAGAQRWERPPARVIGPGSGELWRRAPWPVNDSLFELGLPAEPGVLVAVEDSERRAALLDRVGDAAPAEGCERLTEEALRRASVVVMAAAPSRFPARAFAVLAARRVLVLDELPAPFGLLRGRDHVQAASDAEAVLTALSVSRHPGSFRWMRELGALAAERHRASRVYARLLTDLELEGVAR
jgi:hypothetical protein